MANNHKFSNDPVMGFKARLDAMEQEINRLKNTSLTTVPLYDQDTFFTGDAVEGQVVIDPRTDTPKYRSSGVWHEFGGSGGGGGGALIAGSVYDDGSIRLPASSPGFTVTLVSNGSPAVPAEYAIVFDVNLPVEPVVELTVNNNNGVVANDSTYQAGIKDGSTSISGFSVLTRAFDPTAPVNTGGFDFACFAPGVGTVGTSASPITSRAGWTGLGTVLAPGASAVVDFADAGTLLPDFADGLPQPFLDYTDILDPAVLVDGMYCLQIEFNSFQRGNAGEMAHAAIYMAQASTNQLFLPKNIRTDSVPGADGAIREVITGIWPISAGDSFSASIDNKTSNSMTWNWITYISRIS